MSGVAFYTFCQARESGAGALTLWYDTPAAHWVAALPLGNGRLGTMVYGITTQDTIQINEDTYWSGSPYNNANPNARAHLDEIRRLIDEGDYASAQKLSLKYITADRSVTGHGMIYESVGNLLHDFPPEHAAATGYRRPLDLNEAVAHVAYTAGGIDYTRDVVTSLADI